MKTKDFVKKLTSIDLKENIHRQFGINVDFESYDREQLEDFRNKLRTKVFQKESVAGINALLTDEGYQKDKAMLELLNRRIKEMLGEDLKKLRDKIDALEEAKKGVRAPKYTKKAKGSDGNLANNYPPYDKVTRGDVIAGATGKDQKGGKAKDQKTAEGRRITGKGYDNPEHERKAPGGSVPMTSLIGRKGDDPSDEKSARRRDQEARMTALSAKGTKVAGKAQSAPQKESAEKCNHTPKGKKCSVHGLKECGTMEAKEKPSAGMSKAEKSAVVKKAKAGGDIGKKGKGFKDVEAAAKKGGAKDPKAVAAAAMWKQQAKKESQEIFRRHVRIVNESLAYLIQEDEEGKAKAITAAGDMVMITHHGCSV